MSSSRNCARTACAALALAIVAPLHAQLAACPPDVPCPGVDFAAGYSGDFRRNTHGGLETGNAVSGLLEAGVVWRSDRLFPGALVTSSASLINVDGEHISGRRVGDLQGLNNIEADAGWYLYDLWTEISFGSRDAASVRAGFLDLNAEFDSSDTAGFFILPSFGIGTDLAQTGENGPAVYPVTALGVRLQGQLADTMQWRLAAYEGTPGRTDRHRLATVDVSRDEGALLIGELDFTPRRLHKLAIGAWGYTAAFERMDAASSGNATRAHGNRGAYALIDAPLGSLGGARVDGVLRVGVAAARFNAVSSYAGAAVVVSGLLPGRPQDGLGMAVAHARTGNAFRGQLASDGGVPARAETTFEVTWRAPLAEWFTVVPGLQWVDSPGADRALSNALVAGVRFEMSWARSWQLMARQQNPAREDSLVVASEALQ
jgi:porin